jgi:Phospholipid methyltransferase
MALPLALSGFLLALAGMALVLRSRTELGSAWSFVAKADQGTGLVTTWPYRLVRHPIYLGFALLATGQALAFGSWRAGQPSPSCCSGSSRPSPGALARRRSSSAAYLASATPSTKSAPR